MKIAIYHGSEFGDGLNGEIMDILNEFEFTKKLTEIHYNTDCAVKPDDLCIVPTTSDAEIIRNDLYVIPDVDKYIILTNKVGSSWTKLWVDSLHYAGKNLIIIENGK